MKDRIKNSILKAGAESVGFAQAGEIDSEVHTQFEEWATSTDSGDMNFLRRHVPLRFHTDYVLPGAKTVITVAFNYRPSRKRRKDLPFIASYAYGDDYHIVCREILKPLVKEFEASYGGNWRICIDSAPIAERYWAVKAGLGKILKNGNILVKSKNSMCFLVEILTTLEINPDPVPQDEIFCRECLECNLCTTACPGSAIKGDGTIRAQNCINYLTIEKKSDLSQEDKKIINKSKGFLFGCDICQKVCPLNQEPSSETNDAFLLNEEIATLTPAKILEMTPQEFKTCFQRSPLLHASHSVLTRTALTLIKSQPGENSIFC